MSSTTVDPAQERVRLRDEYKLTAHSIVKALQSQPKPAYTRAELTRLQVSVQTFNSEDQGFIDSEACLFQPLSQEELVEYTIDQRRLSKGQHHYLYEFGKTFNESSSYIKSEDERKWYRIGQILKYFHIFQDYYKKEDEEVVEDSKPRDLPAWSASSICHWSGRFGDMDEDTRPPMRLVTLSGAEPREEELLHAELGSIVNTIQCRLARRRFEYTSLFPVLVISLFGPRHGRLLQARFDISGTLHILSSPVYSFVDSDENMELFIRYINCTPRDGDEFRPAFIHDDSPSSQGNLVPRIYEESARWHAEMVLRC